VHGIQGGAGKGKAVEGEEETRRGDIISTSMVKEAVRVVL